MRLSTRAALVGSIVTLCTLGPAGAALACGGLVAPNGTVSLLRTTTLAAYHGGIEHYVTAFQFAGVDAKEVGSIVPLPGVPTAVYHGGDWTLQRLELEVQPPVREATASLASAPAAGSAQVLLETQVDALDITVLKGGAVAVGNWAREHGFFLPPDAPEVLDFYAQRSPIFLAARFNAERAQQQGLASGQATPVHIVIPTPNPWVPLRILALGRRPTDLVQADVFLLTDREPAMLPQTIEPNASSSQIGLIRQVSEPASPQLLTDLRSDRGHMNWIPDHMWLTEVKVNAPASEVTHDLAIDATGFGNPNPVAAGYPPGTIIMTSTPIAGVLVWIALLIVAIPLVLTEIERRRGRRTA